MVKYTCIFFPWPHPSQDGPYCIFESFTFICSQSPSTGDPGADGFGTPGKDGASGVRGPPGNPGIAGQRGQSGPTGYCQYCQPAYNPFAYQNWALNNKG